MNKAGKSILWFLGACLLLTEAIAGFVLKINDDVSSLAVLAFALLCLFGVLFALLYLYKTDPSFLLAENPDVRFLSTLRSVAATNSPELIAEVIKHLDPRALEAAETQPTKQKRLKVEPIIIPGESVDESSEPAETEREELEITLKSLTSQRED